MNNLISWVKRTICCLLSGRGSSQKAREETWEYLSQTCREMSRGGSGASAQPRGSLESPDPCQGRTGGTGTAGCCSMEEDGQRREGKRRRAQAEHPRVRWQQHWPGLPGDLFAFVTYLFWPLQRRLPAQQGVERPGLCSCSAQPAMGTALIQRGFAPLSPS